MRVPRNCALINGRFVDYTEHPVQESARDLELADQFGAHHVAVEPTAAGRAHDLAWRKARQAPAALICETCGWEVHGSAAEMFGAHLSHEGHFPGHRVRRR